MLNSSHITPSIATSPDGSARGTRDEALVRLLAAAAATFDSDRDRAKACVQQAAELLQPPFAYVTVRRIRRAQAIMLNTREPLSQVALECGMCDQAHFTRVFRKVVGNSLSLWRRQFQSEPMSAVDMLRRATDEVSESQIASHLVRRDAAATSSPARGRRPNCAERDYPGQTSFRLRPKSRVDAASAAPST